MPAITVRDLRKVYGAYAAVDGLSFTVDHGEVFALLGPNGAGKTTTVEILEGHRRRTAGQVDVLGWDPQDGGRAYRERIGIVLQEAGFEDDFTVRELVRLYRGMYPRRLSADEVIELVGLTDKRDARVKSLSGGQQRRLDLALGLVGDPDLLFLDEPTTGFDPSARRRAWSLVESLRALGKTVLLTTHYMDEAEHLADRLGVVVRGRLIACGAPEEIVAAAGGSSVVSWRLPAGSSVSDLPPLGGAGRGPGSGVAAADRRPDEGAVPVDVMGRASAAGRSRSSPSPNRRWRTSTSSSSPGTTPTGPRRCRRSRRRRPACPRGCRDDSRPPGRGTRAAVQVQKPHAASLMADQLVYTLRELWRSRVVFVFTFLFPLSWLLVLGFLAGNETVEGSPGIRVMQFVTPSAAAMGVTYAAFPTVAITLSLARESGVLKRVRGTPLPAWVYLAGRIGAAVVFALGSVLLMLTVGVLAYDVQIVTATLPATVVTIALAIACFAALGLAVASVSPSATFAQAAAIGSAVVVTFLSGMYSDGEQAAWADRIASVLPLKPFNDALEDQFDPLASGAGWDVGALLIMAAWMLGALAVAVRAFGWDPKQRTGRTAGRAPGDAGARRPSTTSGAPAVEVAARPGAASMLLQQVRHTTVAAWRDPGWVFFAVALPVGLFSYNLANYGGSGIELHGASYVVAYAAGMITWGAAVTGFVNMPAAIAEARDSRVLKRLRGTPISPVLYIAGRVVSALWIALLTAAFVIVVGVAFFDLRPDWVQLPVATGVLLLGTTTFAAAGVALSSLLPSSKAVSAVALALLLPLSFFSDIFVIVGLPGWMETVGSLLPFKHTANLVATLMEPGLATSWSSVLVLFSWLAVAGWVAVRTFRWESRT